MRRYCVLAISLLLISCSAKPSVDSTTVSQPQSSSPTPTVPASPSPSSSPEPVESKLDSQQLKNAQQILKVATILEKQGREMEKLRTSEKLSDMKQCGQLMRQRQGIANKLQAQVDALPKGEFRTVPLISAIPNLNFCVSCSETAAIKSCDAAKKDLQEAQSTLKQ